MRVLRFLIAVALDMAIGPAVPFAVQHLDLRKIVDPETAIRRFA